MATFWLQTGQSLLVIPCRYDQVRPHHMVLFAGLWSLMASSAKKHLKSDLLQRVKLTLTSWLANSSTLEDAALALIQKGWIPDFLVRFGIRLKLRDHLYLLQGESAEQELQQKMDIVRQLQTSPIAIQTDAANQQHYEVPAAFYDLCLGPRKKYSSGYWPSRKTTFAESEVAMLDLYCQRAGVVNGMKIVDLGCGWGSLTLYLAEMFPDCKITGISNSHSQREYILSTAKTRGLNVNNITIVTCNVADDKGALDQVGKDNDLVITIEMFEHMKNYQTLLHKIHGFLKPNGKLFVHIFTHKDYAYHFEEGWMSENFFTGGTMPSDDLLLYFAKDFCVEQHWRVNGSHYERTSNGWLAYLDANWKNGSLQPVLAEAYGEGKEREWYANWRVFFLACAELWGLDKGEEWIVSHYLFQRR